MCVCVWECVSLCSDFGRSSKTALLSAVLLFFRLKPQQPSSIQPPRMQRQVRFHHEAPRETREQRRDGAGGDRRWKTEQRRVRETNKWGDKWRRHAEKEIMEQVERDTKEETERRAEDFHYCASICISPSLPARPPLSSLTRQRAKLRGQSHQHLLSNLIFLPSPPEFCSRLSSTEPPPNTQSHKSTYRRMIINPHGRISSRKKPLI